MKLREAAREVLEPASAFMFFEQQLGELIEDYGLLPPQPHAHIDSCQPGAVGTNALCDKLQTRSFPASITIRSQVMDD